MEVALLKRTVYSKPFVVPPSLLQAEESQELHEKSTKSIIKDAVMIQLTGSTYRSRFTLSQLYGDGQLLRTCVQRVKTECGKDDESQIRGEFQAVISNLAKEGDIIPEVETHARETVYKVHTSSTIKLHVYYVKSQCSSCSFCFCYTYFLRYSLRKSISCQQYWHTSNGDKRIPTQVC